MNTVIECPDCGNESGGVCRILFDPRPHPMEDIYECCACGCKFTDEDEEKTMADFDPDKYIEDGSDGEIEESRSAPEKLAEMTGEPEEEFAPDGYDNPNPDELERVDVDEYRTSESVCEFIQSAMNDGKEELAEKALRTAVEKGWTEAWFQKSSNVTESERPPLSQRVCGQDFEEWWSRNYE